MKLSEAAAVTSASNSSLIYLADTDDGGSTYVTKKITKANLLSGISQTGAEIKTAYEAESNTNAYTDAEKSKLTGVAASANNYSISSDLLDEDNFASDSATKAASQQSIKAYVDTEVAGLVNSAPGTLDTLDELAAALGDDANYAATVTTSLGLKAPKASPAFTGDATLAGDLTVNTDAFFVDASAKNVGVGTASPSSDGGGTLEVKAATTPTFLLNHNGDFKSLLQLRGNDLEIRGSSGKIEFYADNDDGASSTHRMRITSSGSLEIGPAGAAATTITAAGAITTAGYINTTAQVYTGGAYAGNAGCYLAADGLVMGEQAVEGNHVFRGKYNGTTTSTIKGSGAATFAGNLQVGTASTAGTYVRVQRSDAGNVWSGNNATTNTSSIDKDGAASFAGAVISGTTPNWGSATSTGIELNPAASTNWVGIKNSSGSTATNTAFQVVYGTDTTVSFLNNGAATFAGNVLAGGAATTTQGTALSTAGNGSVVAYSSSTADQSQKKFYIYNGNTGTFPAFITAAGAATFASTVEIGTSGSPGWIKLYGPGEGGAAGRIRNAGCILYENGDSQFTGKMGIGTTTPYSLLEINGPDGTISGISLGSGGSATASRYIGICHANDHTQIGTNSGFSGIEFGGPSSTDEGYLAFHTHDNGVNSGERMRINKSGAATFSSTVTCTSLTETSDIALKTDVEPIINVLDKIQQITGYTYKFKNTGRDSMGVTAQDVEKVFPELVHGEDGAKSLQYSGLIGALIESVKELSNKVAALEAA